MADYNPLYILAAGLSTLIGLWGLGTTILFYIRMHLPSPWSNAIAILLGIQTVGLAVQIVGMTGAASRYVLQSIWCSMVSIGILTLLLQARPAFIRRLSRSNWVALLPIAVLGAAIGTNFLVALAPSTKIDELYYHMLLPSRIVSDGALRFYREPWEGAIWPDMIYQISSAPLHAIGYPDAANVVSWGLDATLLWFAWRTIRANKKPVVCTALWVGTLCVGMYPVVWDVTGGANSMGDLAMAAAVVALCSQESKRNTVSPPIYAALLSFFLMCAATSKISLLPLCGFILCAAAWTVLRTASARWDRILFALAAPWVVFYCPILLLTWVQSGSPFGPVLSDFFASSVYAHNWAKEVFRATRDANRPPLLTVIAYAAVDCSPLVWMGAIGAMLWTDLAASTRTKLFCFILLQGGLVFWLLPYDVRFMGGLHYGLMIAFACFSTPNIVNRMTSPRIMTTACVALLLPWFGIQFYYASQFFSVALGLEKLDFFKRYVAFYDDYIKLDQILPKQTVLLVQDYRIDAVYAPRPVFFDVQDLPAQQPVALLTSAEVSSSIAAMSGGYSLGEVLYENDRAIVETFRTPGRLPLVGRIQVISLIKK